MSNDDWLGALNLATMWMFEEVCYVHKLFIHHFVKLYVSRSRERLSLLLIAG